jgi:hypothetical protein
VSDIAPTRRIAVNDQGYVAEAATVLVRTHLWIWWAEIALDQESLAQEMRERAVTVTPRGEGFANLIGEETRAALIAIAAASHALDALYGVVKEVVSPVWSERRWSAILETLKAGFVIRGSAGGGRWARDFEWLFKLRDAAVHFEESQKPTVPHPTGTHTGPENVMYSLEPAERAVSLMLEVLDVCTKNPRRPLATWAKTMRPTVEQLHARRGGPTE